MGSSRGCVTGCVAIAWAAAGLHDRLHRHSMGSSRGSMTGGVAAHGQQQGLHDRWRRRRMGSSRGCMTGCVASPPHGQQQRRHDRWRRHMAAAGAARHASFGALLRHRWQNTFFCLDR
eukprot:364764-Chlamydomonas_euryale.AAC.9